tara:strand:- start:259 stop:516 length:258 start_codon:yes stop_codon:yes gene_type:complete
MSNLVTEKEAIQALNQLVAVVVGRRFAMQTEEYRDSPSLRIEKCHRLVLNEYSQAIGDPIKTSQVKRKLDSINSLAVLAKIADTT